MKIKNTEVESTPFAEIRLTATKKYEARMIRLYWSARKGHMGYQVCSQVLDFNNSPIEDKTSGHGYCKESFALLYALSEIIGKSPYTCLYSVDNLFYKFKKGGNYYELSQAQLREVLGGLE